MVINTNQAALRGARLLSDASTRLSKSLARLSSGSKIISPEDDAAGLAQSIKLTAASHRNTAAMSNLQNAVSYSQTQDGYLQKVQKALDRMSELAVLAQDVTKTDLDRTNYDVEFQKLKTFIGETFNARFNDVGLFSGTSTFVTNVPLQSGASVDSNVIDTQGNSGQIDITFDFFGGADEIRVYYPPQGSGGSLVGTTGVVSGNGNVSISFGPGPSSLLEIVVDQGRTPTPWNYSAVITATNASTGSVTTDGEGSTFGLGVINPLSVSGAVDTSAGALAALTSVKSAIETLAQDRAKVGGNISRLQSHLDELSILNENLDAATSRITDADIAEESTRFARNNILVQSGTAMLAQANILPESALRLLGG